MQRTSTPAVAALEAELERAIRSGRPELTAQLWQRILAEDPRHVGALAALGQSAFRNGDLAQARDLLERLLALQAGDKQQWVNLAVVCNAQGDDAAQEQALRSALSIDPYDFPSLVLRADLYRRQGRVHEAARAYGAVAAVAPPMEQLPPQLRPALEAALAYRAQYDSEFARHLDRHLESVLRDTQGEDVGRFRESLDIMLGRKRRYDSQSMLFHYHGLAPQAFFPRARFPWLEQVEAATDAIRGEFLAVLESDNGFQPYMTYEPDQPVAQWKELNQSLRWSACHLIKNGETVGENAARCPHTMATLLATPLPQQPGRTPSAMFSLLKPKTRIPPHVGASNVRLVCHLPLIIPPDCGIRVGNESRGWQPGQAFVFDDTIEHEAWNDSEQLRVVLIFDTWHPDLNPAERALVTAMSDGIRSFSQESDPFGL